MAKNTQISAYSDIKRPLKFHEEELLRVVAQDEIISNALRCEDSAVLDIGCADGNLIQHMLGIYRNVEYTGIDISEQLISIARQRTYIGNTRFLVEDALSHRKFRTYDLAIASGIMSIFDDFTVCIDTWLRYLREGGNLLIFGRFNSKHCDTRVLFRNHFNGAASWEGGLTSFSLKTVGDYLNSRRLSFEFTRFLFPGSLQESEDPIRNYTIETATGSKIMVNGANVLAEYFYLKIRNV